MSYLATNEDALTLENDLFGTKAVAGNIVAFIRGNYESDLFDTDKMIALYGDWGSGKTRVLKTVYSELNEDKKKGEKINVVWYDAWKYEKDDNLQLSLVKFIRTKLGIEPSLTTELVAAYEYFRDTAVNLIKHTDIELSLLGVCKVKTKLSSLIDPMASEKKKCIWELHDELKKQFRLQTTSKQHKGKRIFVILDDLDRCASENMITLLNDMKNLMTLSTEVVFIVGIDKKAVAVALANKYGNTQNSANEYLGKIFSFKFEMPKKMKTNLIIQKGLGFQCDELALLLESLGFTNPRHIVRIMNNFRNWVDSLGSLKYVFKSKPIFTQARIFPTILIMYLIILRDYAPSEYEDFFNVKERIADYTNRLIIEEYDTNTKVSVNQPAIVDFEPKLNLNDIKVIDLFTEIVYFYRSPITKLILLGPRLIGLGEYIVKRIEGIESIFLYEQDTYAYKLIQYLMTYEQDSEKSSNFLIKRSTEDFDNLTLSQLRTLVETGNIG